MENEKITESIKKLESFLEGLPNVKVVDDCYGEQYLNYLNIWIQCNDFYTISVIARAFSKNYISTENRWFVSLNSNDVKTSPQFGLLIHLIEKPKNEESVINDIEKILINLKYWSQNEFKEYFSNE